MNRKLIAAFGLSIALVGVAGAQGTTSSLKSDVHYSRIQLKRMAKEAHTPEDFKLLADYYAGQQRAYSQLADKEKQEWLQLSRDSGHVAAKYPRPAEWARIAYEYDLNKAAKVEPLAAKYESMAMTKTVAPVQ